MKHPEDPLSAGIIKLLALISAAGSLLRPKRGNSPAAASSPADFAQIFSKDATVWAIEPPEALGSASVNRRADTCHHPLTALGRLARFVVLTFVDGTETDEQFVPLQEAVKIEA